jgi:hypothetical protein
MSFRFGSSLLYGRFSHDSISLASPPLTRNVRLKKCRFWQKNAGPARHACHGRRARRAE